MLLKYDRDIQSWWINAPAVEICSIPNEVLKAMSVVLSRMDETGTTTLTLQEYMKLANVSSKTTAINHLNKLAEFTLNEKPIFVKEKYKTKNGFGWEATVYSLYKEEAPVVVEKKALTPKDVILHFCKRYEEVFGVKYNPVWSKHTGIVKSKLIGTYSDELIIKGIDYVIENWNRKWKTKQFVAPHIGTLTTFVWNDTMMMLTEQDKKEKEVEDNILSQEQLDAEYDRLIAEMEGGK